MAIRIIQSASPVTDPAVRAVRDRLRSGGVTSGGESGVNVASVVSGIIRSVQRRGDEAVAELTSQYDRAAIAPTTLRVPAEGIRAAWRAADKEFLKLIRRVIKNIREYQQRIKVNSPPPLRRGGRSLGVRYTPVDRVGLYVPGGQAVYPSSVLMTAVPAQVAGVRQIALASPPRTSGDVNPLVLALAGELGITEVYRMGGAVAMAALAMGTASIPAVDKICGPGNAFVTEAKRQLLGRVGIDSLAGPSEVLILADASANAEWVAADMLAQAEHDPGSAVLVTNSKALAEKVVDAIDGQLAALERREAIAAALAEYSAVIVVPSMDAACEVANDFATEHLQIIARKEKSLLAKVRHAGAIFLGAYSPVPLGDYYAGPSHVLPTGGTARFFGPLSCNDFLKASSVIRYDRGSLTADSGDVQDFAAREGLTAHAAAVKKRLATKNTKNTKNRRD